MEVFPIIYSRNYYMDYSQNFYLCPENIDNAIIEKIRKCVLDAIKYPNMISTQRRIIISENGYTTLGIVCDLKEYVSSGLEEAVEYNKYTHDNKDRSVISFLGVVFKSDDLKKNNVVVDFDQVIKNLFIKYIANDKMWFDDSTNHYVSEIIEVDVDIYKDRCILGPKVEFFGRKIYICSEDTDKDLFMRIMALCGGGVTNFHFCSDYYGIESIKDSPFRVLTSKYIEKIKNMLDIHGEGDVQSKRKKQKKTKKMQKKNKILISSIIALAIIVIILIIIEIGRRVT